MKLKYSVIISLFALGGCSMTPVAPDYSKPVKTYPDYGVSEKTLKNGLKVIVKEDHRAPVAVSQVWYKVGSSYEHSGITGISHMLEHMMFKGTKKHPPGEFSRIIAENGGSENAFTGKDYTAYFQQLEKSRLPISFELEADRMRNVVFLKKEFKKERQVVIEERRMRTDDDPQALTSEMFNAAAYVNSGYHAPVIGWRTDLDNYKVTDVAAWYKTWYAPNNATLVVVGDVNPDDIFAKAEHYFGGNLPEKIPVRKPRTEIKQLGERDIVVKAPAKVPYLMMGYQAASVVDTDKDWEPYALEVLANVLDGGISARMETNLVRKQQVASSIGTSYDAFTPGRELFTFSGVPAQGHNVKDLENAIKEQVHLVRTQLVTDGELARVKAQVVASKVYQKDSIFYQAMTIGMMETIGLDWTLSEQYADRINKVTKEQIQQVAKKYLVDDNLTVAVLDPQPIDPNKPRRVWRGR